MGQRIGLLTEYVAAVAREVIADRKALMLSPYVCTADALASAFGNDLTEAMRNCIRSGEFGGHINVNKKPMLTLKEDAKP